MAIHLDPETEAALRSEADMRGVSLEALALSREWVALERFEVIAHGKNGRAVSAFARSKDILSPFLLFVADTDPLPFAGGWLEPVSE